MKLGIFLSLVLFWAAVISIIVSVYDNNKQEVICNEPYTVQYIDENLD